MSSDALMLVLVLLAVAAATPWLCRRGPGRPRVGEVRRTWWRQQRTVARVDDAVVLDLIRAALTAGADVVTAIESVGAALPDDQGAAAVRSARALRWGASWSQAWPGGGAVADALESAWTDGVDPDPLLAHAAATIRRRRHAAAREAAARLGVRLVLPLGLCLLPAFVLLGLVPVLIAAGLDLWGG